MGRPTPGGGGGGGGKRGTPALGTAWATTVLLTVSLVISSDSRIGTPDRRRVARVRQKRVIAVLCTSLPKIGTRSLNRSQWARPVSVRIQRRNAITRRTSKTTINGA